MFAAFLLNGRVFECSMCLDVVHWWVLSRYREVEGMSVWEREGGREGGEEKGRERGGRERKREGMEGKRGGGEGERGGRGGREREGGVERRK